MSDSKSGKYSYLRTLFLLLLGILVGTFIFHGYELNHQEVSMAAPEKEESINEWIEDKIEPISKWAEFDRIVEVEDGKVECKALVDEKILEGYLRKLDVLDYMDEKKIGIKNCEKKIVEYVDEYCNEAISNLIMNMKGSFVNLPVNHNKLLKYCEKKLYADLDKIENIEILKGDSTETIALPDYGVVLKTGTIFQYAYRELNYGVSRIILYSNEIVRVPKFNPGLPPTTTMVQENMKYVLLFTDKNKYELTKKRLDKALSKKNNDIERHD